MCQTRGQRSKVRKLLRQSQNFDEWCATAQELDRVEGRDAWKVEEESPLYDYKLVRQNLDRIRECKEAGDIPRLASLLSVAYTRFVNINHEQLYSHTFYGTKTLIEDLIREIRESTEAIRDAPEAVFSLPAKMEFVQKARLACGRTALCLSGGATMAYFHFGVVKALIEYVVMINF